MELGHSHFVDCAAKVLAKEVNDQSVRASAVSSSSSSSSSSLLDSRQSKHQAQESSPSGLSVSTDLLSSFPIPGEDEAITNEIYNGKATDPKHRCEKQHSKESYREKKVLAGTHYGFAGASMSPGSSRLLSFTQVFCFSKGDPLLQAPQGLDQSTWTADVCYHAEDIQMALTGGYLHKKRIGLELNKIASDYGLNDFVFPNNIGSIGGAPTYSKEAALKGSIRGNARAIMHFDMHNLTLFRSYCPIAQGRLFRICSQISALKRKRATNDRLLRGEYLKPVSLRHPPIEDRLRYISKAAVQSDGWMDVKLEVSVYRFE